MGLWNKNEEKSIKVVGLRLAIEQHTSACLHTCKKCEKRLLFYYWLFEN